jgi:tetratricopeptide (TPR) repeat protein
MGKLRPARHRQADLEMTAPVSFAQALQAHRQGRFDEADALYQAVTPTDPRYADALHLRGLLRHQQGRDAEAQGYIEAALKVQPRHALAWSSLGAVQARLGRPGAALGCFDRALALKPAFAEALNNRGNALRDLGRPEAALASYDQALAIAPKYLEALNNRGNALRDLKRPEDALASYDRALTLKPDFPEILCNRGNALRDLDRPAEALANFDQALALKPDYAEAWVNRGNALKDLARLDAALASYGRALEVNPKHPVAHYNHGSVLRELRRPTDAIESFDRALAIKPGYAEALNDRGAALLDLRRSAEALASVERALERRPDYVEALFNRGNALRELGRHDDALASYDRALVLKPDSVEALNNRGNALRDLGRVEAALASYDRAIALRPAYATGYDNKSLALTELGRFDEATAAIEHAIALDPERIRSYYDLTLLPRRWSPDDPHLRKMEALARDIDRLSPDERIDLHFALGKALAELAPERAFRHLIDGNAAKRRQISYDEAAALALLDRTRTAYTPALFSDKTGGGDPSPAPIFILGLPRSGTSLIEQILASHPEICGIGEADEFRRVVEGFPSPVLQKPETVAQLTGAALRDIGTAYSGRLAGRAPSAVPRIADKTLWNFQWAGLLHLALPNARIIHCRRDPLDTCLSCFSHRFAGNIPYAYDLGELGRYYRAYDSLMTHWQAALPPAIMIEVQYEAVVADLEGEARRILAHCGLDWHPRCLDFHRTERAVRTASMTQVRQPLYRHAVGRWRAYEAFLGPLIEALGLPAETVTTTSQAVRRASRPPAGETPAPLTVGVLSRPTGNEG